MKEWHSRAVELKQLNPDMNNMQITKMLQEEYPEIGLNWETVRKCIQKNAVIEKPEEKPIAEKLITDLRIGIDTDYAAKKYKVSPRVFDIILEEIKEQGYSIVEVEGKLKINKCAEVQFKTVEKNWNGDKIFRFGVVSDTHLCNKWQQITFLNHLYDMFQAEGLNTVYHVGDMVDGYYKNRPSHIYELFKIGFDEQKDYVISNYPKRPNIITEFITGNHDHTHILNGGADIGRPIAAARPDMIYHGQANVKIKLTPNCSVELNHPLDGTAYALSYSVQRYIESISGGEKPNILLNGHHHKALTGFYRNIHFVECGTTEDQTPWMKGKRISAHMGGYIIEIHVDKEGTITRIKTELIPLYKPIENDY